MGLAGRAAERRERERTGRTVWGEGGLRWAGSASGESGRERGLQAGAGPSGLLPVPGSPSHTACAHPNCFPRPFLELWPKLGRERHEGRDADGGLTMSTPKDHQSALCVCPRRFTTSGAMYSMVPQKE